MECKRTSRKWLSRMPCFSKKRERVRSFRSAEEGATLVEMALASSILFASVFGIIIMSFALYSYDFIADAARMGARYAMVRGSYCTGFSDCNVTEAQIASYVQSLAYPGINASNLTVTASWYFVNRAGGATTTISLCADSNPTGCNVPGKYAVEVRVKYTYPISVPFWRSTSLDMYSKSQLLITQ
jgi:Flp pilus assembly protein TadG